MPNIISINRRSQPRRAGGRDAYSNKLHEIVRLIYDEAANLDWSLADLARNARYSDAPGTHVSYTAVRNLCYNGVTKSPHFRTIFALAKAVGLEIHLEAVRAGSGRRHA